MHTVSSTDLVRVPLIRCTKSMAGSKSAICARSAREKIEEPTNGSEDNEELEDDATDGTEDDDDDETDAKVPAAWDGAGALMGVGVRAYVPSAGLSAVRLSCCWGRNLCHAPSDLTSFDQQGCIVPVEKRVPKIRVDRKKASISAVQSETKENK